MPGILADVSSPDHLIEGRAPGLPSEAFSLWRGLAGPCHQGMALWLLASDHEP